MNSAALPRPGWQSFSTTGDEEASFLATGADLPGANTHSGGGVIAMRDLMHPCQFCLEDHEWNKLRMHGVIRCLHSARFEG